MSSLADLKCEACEKGGRCVTGAESLDWLKETPEWRIVEREGVQRLERVYSFPDFAQAVDFTNKVAALAEEVGHHPALLTEWGRVTVSWWTHKIKGLHRNDFIMAAKTDAIYGKRAP
ncbi:MAG: 4a-hydroxytetrahydrobiopterin dehydratase [Planctomycetes bacterium]|nr:4a-hydroxytetrahydrobiopterin dehydratase [Planctomycetota bacterium]